MGAQDPSYVVLHSCITNLVIGTLYCSRGNWEFGVNRVIRALDPPAARLSPTTWYYAKRCIVALLDCMAKQMVALKVACAPAKLVPFVHASNCFPLVNHRRPLRPLLLLTLSTFGNCNLARRTHPLQSCRGSSMRLKCTGGACQPMMMAWSWGAEATAVEQAWRPRRVC